MSWFIVTLIQNALPAQSQELTKGIIYSDSRTDKCACIDNAQSSPDCLPPCFLTDLQVRKSDPIRLF